jgi:hypothetical protein
MTNTLAAYGRATADVFDRIGVVWPVAALAAVTIAFASREALPVVVPLVAMVGLAAVVVLHLYTQEGQLPVFDVGVLTILITTAYSSIPLLGFWLAGLHWTDLTYLPLVIWNPGPMELGAFSIRHVVYLYSLAGAYLLFRGRVPIRSGPVRELHSTEIAAIAVCGVVVAAYLTWLQMAYDYSYDPSYRGLTLQSAFAAAERVPYVLRQISHNVFAISILLKCCALVWLMSHWRDWRWRTVLFVWLATEGVTTVLRMGARTFFVTLLLAAVLLYHRLVRPLPFARAVLLAVLLLGGALLYGLARDLTTPAGVGGLDRLATTTSSRWATMNEFQALYGIAYDLHERKAAGLLGPIPWQIYASDLLQLVPSQFLPFGKADPCLGYPVVDGVGLGCVLGVISQAVIGLDWIELIVRGLVLGLALALVHRWYARRQDGYWTTMLYLALCLWCYYTFRGSTFFIAYYVVYRFVPLVVAVGLVQLLIRRIMRFADACGV